MNCRKRPYKDRAEAKAALRRIHRVFPDRDEKDVYRCPICTFWHLTSMTKEECRELTRKNQNTSHETATRNQRSKGL